MNADEKGLNLQKGGGTMLYEATIAFLSLMFVTWAVAVWATYREDENTQLSSSSEEAYRRSA